MKNTLLLIILASTTLITNAADISGIHLNDTFESVKHKLPSSITSKPTYKGGDLGFMTHSSVGDGISYGITTRPDDTIYQIQFFQEFPLAQADSIKSMLCKKYGKPERRCLWSAKYENLPSNSTQTLFSLSKYGKKETVNAQIDRVFEKINGKSQLKPEVIAVTIRLYTRKVSKELAMWKQKLEREKSRNIARTALEESKSAPKKTPLF